MIRRSRYEYPSVRHRIIGYPYRVWVFSILAAPLACFLFRSINDSNRLGLSPLSIIFYFFEVAVLIAFSAPSIGIYIIIFWMILDKDMPPVIKKCILVITSFISLWLTAYFLGLFFSGKGFISASIEITMFSLTISILSFIFSLEETK